jgi:sulfatase modifying factor 1
MDSIVRTRKVVDSLTNLCHRSARLCALLLVMVGCPSELPTLEPAENPSEETGGTGEGTGANEADTTSTATTEPGADGVDTTLGAATESSPECGNGQVEEGESCEGTDLVGSTCENLGQAPGTLGCTTDCMFDVSGCVPPGMVLVPGGMFVMGSTEPGSVVRLVTVDEFYIDATEVTVEDYVACPQDICSTPAIGIDFNYGAPGRVDHPINGVDWFDADAYCRWVDGEIKRLPTEAEWEKAARGTDARNYPWGNAPEANCTYTVMRNEAGENGCGMDSTWPVGSKLIGVSPYGGLDMAGNVWEWVSDWHEPYDLGETNNPTGPTDGIYRVLRGGSWSFDDPLRFRTTFRFFDLPSLSARDVGFRCVWAPAAMGQSREETSASTTRFHPHH